MNDLETLIRPGDVLLFSYEKDDFTSSMIAFLTDSSVSHAAIGYATSPCRIVEETPPQVCVNDAAERFQGRTITVRRLKDPTLSTQPLIVAADAHLNRLDPYSDAGLYLLGIVLISKKFVPKVGQERTLEKLLDLCCVAITAFLDGRKDPGKLPMTCSHFVSQCYADAAKATGDNRYELTETPPNVVANAAPDTLLTLAVRELTKENGTEENDGEPAFLDAKAMSPEALRAEANRLARLYLEAETCPTGTLTGRHGKGLWRRVVRLAKALLHLWLGDDPKEAALDQLLALFDQHRHMLVTPADLLACEKLETVTILPEASAH